MSQKPVTSVLCRLFLMFVLVGLTLSNSEIGGVFSVHAEKMANEASAISQVTLVNLTVNKSGNGSGTITSNPAGIDCGLTCTFDFATDTVVDLTASADTGSTFTGWSGGGCSGTGTCTVTMTIAATVTANFDLQIFTLTVSRTGTGSGTVTSSPAGINCGVDCSEPYSYNTSVTLTASADTGSTFTGWSGGGCSGTGTCIVTMTADTTVSANFDLQTRTLTVNKTGTGSGTVTSSPIGIDCGLTCSTAYPYNTTVTLTAAAATGSTFTGWSGAGCTGTGTCIVTMTAAATVTANFDLQTFLLTVNKTGLGSGTVTSSPAGISCGLTCSTSYPYNTAVTLTAVPATGSTFTGWSGAGCTGTGTCIVTMTAAATVTANFNFQTFTLTVAKTGTGRGTVTSAPTGINCGADCTQPYTYNTSVTLTASATTGSTFTGWSGGGCSGTSTCIVMVTAATTVTASFSDTTSPTVTWVSPVVDTQVFDVYNQTVQLKVNASDNVAITKVVFSRWDYALSQDVQIGTVTTAPYQLSFNTSALLPDYNEIDVYAYDAANNSSTTYIWLNNISLTVSKTGTGTGTVTSSPVGIDCGLTCTYGFASTTTVNLTASATADSAFTGWSGGGCSGTGTCTVAMTATTTVTANFDLRTPMLTVNKTGTGSGTVTSVPLGINCGLDCSQPYTLGTSVTLTATAGDNSAFTGWSGACTGSSNPCVVLMNAIKTATANFTALPTNTDIYIGGVKQASFYLLSNESRRKSFASVNNGPVKFINTQSTSMIAAERVIYKVNGINTSFSEMMALPNTQLNATYWLPWYNNVDLDTQLRIGNVSNNTATVHVFIGGNEVTPVSGITLQTGASTRVSYTGVNNGPVKIVSNQNIVAAERVIYKVSGVNTSFTEMMALPNTQLNATYWLPWYNNVDLDTQLRIGNVSNNTATVHVFIGGNEVTPVSGITLQTGASTRVSYTGVNNGPVKIQSNVNIVAAERVIYKVNGVQTSFTEMMAQPNSQLNATYWLPWYNNLDLDTQLRFGLP